MFCELSDAEIIRCDHGFQLFDLDGNGLMNTEEFKDYMNELSLKPSDEEVQDFFENYKIHDELFEVDVTSVVKYLSEFLSGTRDEERLREAFEVFDHEKTGFVLASEMKYMLMNFEDTLTEQEVTELYREVRINDDGEIFYEEFVEVMKPEDPDTQLIVEEYTDTESSSENASECCIENREC
ncbi:unnamed protein product [Brassicogethes aeneus]|uniref:EF-hand domain-containing protein n=1 Tax=Brassicogethes aeneus TaxID=1431903 RepID=A0A9P0FCX1_BRAAE|nr:unnamed protein product [Brassicogethes aeneus]